MQKMLNVKKEQMEKINKLIKGKKLKSLHLHSNEVSKMTFSTTLS